MLADHTTADPAAETTATTIVFGIPMDVDREQTAGEALSATASPPFQFPDWFLDLAPGPATTALAMEHTATWANPLSDRSIVELRVNPHDARDWLASVGVTGSPALAVASEDIAITLIRVGAGQITPPRLMYGVTGPAAGDTIFSAISGPDRVNITGVIDWSADVPRLLKVAQVTDSFEAPGGS